MREHEISRRNFILGIGSLVTLSTLGISEKEYPKERNREILRRIENVDAFVHNAQTRSSYEYLSAISNFIEIDILKHDGQIAIGHSKNEIVSTPNNIDALSALFTEINNYDAKIHIDLKSSDMDLAQQIYDHLPNGSLISTPHHELLDSLQSKDKNEKDIRLLYTINSELKKKEFKKRLASGEKLQNSGISIAHPLIKNAAEVKSYQENDLYVLAYSVNRLDLAARLCKHGVNGITSDSEEVLKLLSARPTLLSQ